jgi:acetyl esterase/lipase
MVRNFPTLYEKDAWEAAQNAGSLMMNIHPDALSDVNKEQILAARAAVADLKNHQLKPFSDGINGEVIYIWGDKMPVTTPAEDLQFPLVNYEGEAIYDNADFVPYIIPYLLENPGEAKGTIIVLSGGGNSSRSNPNEGYRVAPGFNELGYNCILLQRRVLPYNNDDIVMDLQRTVRFVKYHAQEWGIDLEGTLLAVSGYSGGGGNIRTMLQKFYGDITPDQFDPSYVCDEIDAVNSDVDVAHIIYSAGKLETENPHLPHLFIAVSGAE